MALSVAGVIEPALQAAEAGRSVNRPTNDLTAYDLYLRALASISPLWRQEDISSGDRPSSTRRLRATQAMVRPWRWRECARQQLHLNGWARASSHATRRQGLDYARRALRAAGSDPFVLASAAWVFCYFGEDIGGAIALAGALVGGTTRALPIVGNGAAWCGLNAGRPPTPRSNTWSGRCDEFARRACGAVDG